MSRTHDVTISAFDLDRLESELAAVTEQRDMLERELDEVREKLADWENSAAHVEADHPDEVHCGCVPILRKLLCDARLERDEAVNNYETSVLREHRMQEQRDRLAEALDRIAVLHESKEMTGTVDQRIADAYDMRCIAREALAAVKGENNE